MSRRVPLARRNLFQDRRRAALAVSGIAVALLLVLMLNGIVDGGIRQVTAYLRHLSADAIVSQQGVRTMHMSESALPAATAARAAQVPGAAWAASIDYASATVHSPAGRELAYVIGYDTRSGRGGPWEMARGHAPSAGEAVLDEEAANKLGVDVGGSVDVLGQRFQISGVSRGGTSISNTTVFIPAADFAAIRGTAVSYVLVRANRGVAADLLVRRLAHALPDATVQTRGEFISQEGSIIRDMTADILQIMSLTAFLIALAVVALTLFTATLAKLREYAVVKALGASTWRLGRAVLTQAAWSSAVALALAIMLALAMGIAIRVAMPNIEFLIEPARVLRVAVAALAAGSLGALMPLRRLARLDPASAFKD
jgi:putative ABC transport system permease protein